MECNGDARPFFIQRENEQEIEWISKILVKGHILESTIKKMTGVLKIRQLSNMVSFYCSSIRHFIPSIFHTFTILIHEPLPHLFFVFFFLLCKWKAEKRFSSSSSTDGKAKKGWKIVSLKKRW